MARVIICENGGSPAMICDAPTSNFPIDVITINNDYHCERKIERLLISCDCFNYTNCFLNWCVPF
jgi:hypothetical protein